MSNKNLQPYILEIENIVPVDLCADILKEYENSSDWQSAVVGNGTLSKEIRDVCSISVSQEYVISKNHAIRKNIDDSLFLCAKDAIQKYNDAFQFACINQDSGYELLRYKEGQFYKEHVDCFSLQPRSISCSFILNDDYEGGEFSFFQKELVYQPKLGSALIFPSNFMFPHEVLPVTAGTRYSVVTWFI